jgi:HEAT repeat protein
MKALMDVLGDPTENDEVRKAALQAIRANTFDPVAFRRYRPAFHEALRSAATDDDAELRMRALDILALQKDEYAQRLLVEGLETPSKALVPPATALQMIGYDVHAGFYPMLREIAASSSKQPTVRLMALRLLAADSDSTKVFRKIVSDKSENKAVRATSAVALQSLAPKEFATLATKVVTDDDDDDDLRASLITTVTHGPTNPSRALIKKVREIHEAPGGTAQLNRAASKFTQVQRRSASKVR